MLYAGDGSMITGVASLWRHGIRHPVPETVDVLVPALRKVQSAGFARLWRTSRMPARPWTIGGIRFAPAPRAVADAVFLAMPDAWWPAAGVAVEVDSREWHLSPADWERTCAGTPR